jgi:nucleotide-binding universal stress UspA family protein
MSFKTILVPLDGGTINRSVLETAVAAARRFEAHLEVLYVRPNPSEMVRHGTMGLPDSLRKTVIETAETGIKNQAAEVRAIFEKFCKEKNLAIATKPPEPGKPTAAFREESGYSGEALVRRGRLSDLIFVARPDESSRSAQTLETALLETGQPVVVVPPEPKQTIASRITIGWNASAEAARAVSEAMPCLNRAEGVTILASQKRAASADDLAEYLGWHGIKPAIKIFDPDSRSVGEALLAESRKLGADLMVIGGYTHTRARQLLFGGVTSHFLKAADIPVLMAH